MPQTTLERIRRRRERGVAVYLTAFFLIALIPVVEEFDRLFKADCNQEADDDGRDVN